MHEESGWLPEKSTALLLILLIFASIFLFWTYSQYRLISDDAVRVEASPVVEAETQKVELQPHQELLAKIGKYMDLPKDTTPEVSIVNDAEVLKASQSFFENVKKDDTLVVYDDFAVIYREADDTIINSGKVDNGNPPDENINEEEVLSDAPGADTTVEVRNGTVITGYAGRTKDKLVILAYTIAGIGNASKRTYTETVVVIKNNTNSLAVRALERMYSTIATIDLPEGEEPSSADILLILGGAE